jgi:formylglycine-generating enzyme required for sulfatase activity
VGQYSPGGDSPCGCADMAGNVWEWCSSLYKPYRYRADDGREVLKGVEPRVLRGGSWYQDNPAIVRCAYRYRRVPDLRLDHVGFRVARGSLK